MKTNLYVPRYWHEEINSALGDHLRGRLVTWSWISVVGRAICPWDLQCQAAVFPATLTSTLLTSDPDHNLLPVCSTEVTTVRVQG